MLHQTQVHIHSDNVLLQLDEYFLKMYYLDHIFVQLTIYWWVYQCPTNVCSLRGPYYKFLQMW